MEGLAESLDRVAAATRFSGVVRVDRRGPEPLVRTYGLAHRGLRVPVHRLPDTEDYLAVLDGHPQVFAPASGPPTATAATSSSR